jgi:hypothetical protein
LLAATRVAASTPPLPCGQRRAASASCCWYSFILPGPRIAPVGSNAYTIANAIVA